MPDIGAKKVVLPAELLNEPFAFEGQHNGLKPEITTARPRFVMYITKKSTYYTIGSSEAEIYDRGSRVPQKNICNVSVLNVYDTYGLDVAYAFLHYICINKLYSNCESYLMTYLAGSLDHMTGSAMGYYSSDRDAEMFIDLCVARILTELLRRQRLIEPSYEIQSASLPIEIVAKIVNSLRISKQLSEHVLLSRRAELPTLRLVAGWSPNSPKTYLSKSGMYYCEVTTSDCCYLVTLDSDRLALVCGKKRLTHSRSRCYSDRIVCESLSAYDNYSKSACGDDNMSRACKVEQLGVQVARTYASRAVLVRLKSLAAIVTAENIGEVSAWVVQLSIAGHADCLERSAVYSPTELGQELARLIDKTLASAVGH
ncbi:Hypothetical protein POVR2_LOCUS352 [uncultured virus]|nr:Hypothetical protein POVR2_LOCUS352 [uncultured virus]